MTETTKKFTQEAQGEKTPKEDTVASKSSEKPKKVQERNTKDSYFQPAPGPEHPPVY